MNQPLCKTPTLHSPVEYWPQISTGSWTRGWEPLLEVTYAAAQHAIFWGGINLASQFNFISDRGGREAYLGRGKFEN